jgi:hypothetical protein
VEEQMFPAQLGGETVHVPDEPTDRDARREPGRHDLVVAADVHRTGAFQRRRQPVAMGRRLAGCLLMRLVRVRVTFRIAQR